VKEAAILCHGRRNELNGTYYLEGWEWVGDAHIARLSMMAMMDAGVTVDPKPGHTFWLGTLHLRVIDICYDSRSATVAFAGLFSAAIYSLHVIHRLALLIYSRLILTAAVWGLADVAERTMPSINDLHFVKHLKRIKAS
jgi:hypothetical protein